MIYVPNQESIPVVNPLFRCPDADDMDILIGRSHAKSIMYLTSKAVYSLTVVVDPILCATGTLSQAAISATKMLLQTGNVTG